MARTTIYLNTVGRTEEQFRFYARVFETDIVDLQYLRDKPDIEPLPEDESHSLMHAEMVITGDTVLMGFDLVPSMGQELVIGNNFAINLEPDTLDEGKRLFDALSEDATCVVPFAPMFWGAHWGELQDRYGVRWMVTVQSDAT